MSTDGPVTRFTRPSGTPAAMMHSASRTAIREVLGAGFHTTAFPVAIAGPRYSIGILNGKFHGVITAHTPVGRRKVRTRLAGSATGTVSPVSRRASAAARRNPHAADDTPPRDSASGFARSLGGSLARG